MSSYCQKKCDNTSLKPIISFVVFLKKLGVQLGFTIIKEQICENVMESSFISTDTEPVMENMPRNTVLAAHQPLTSAD